MQLPLELWWMHIFPLLKLDDFVNLYRAVPQLRGAIIGYKDWDSAYAEEFPYDMVTLKSSGFDRILERSGAVPIAWGTPFVGALHGRPQINISGKRPTVVQYRSNDIVLMDGYLWKCSQQPRINPQHTFVRENTSGTTTQPLHSVWRRSTNPPSEQYGYPSLSSMGFYQYFPDSLDEESFKHLWKYVLRKQYSQFWILGKRIGVVEYKRGVVHRRVGENTFPEPMQAFCPLENDNYVFLSYSGHVYPYFEGRFDASLSDLPPIKSVLTFDLQHSVRPGRPYKRVGATYGKRRENSAILLSTLGDVYYYDRTSSKCTAIPGLSGIVKLSASNGAFFALSSKGQVFFIGSARKVDPGVDIVGQGLGYAGTSHNDMPLDKTAWSFPETVRHLPAGSRENFYAVLPVEIPLGGVVVDINVFDKSIGALVVPSAAAKRN